MCSVGGLLVGQYGLNAARTIDMTLIKKYLRWLTVLAIICILLRVIWIFDIVIVMKQVVKDEKNDPNYDPTLDNDIPVDYPEANYTIQVTSIPSKFSQMRRYLKKYD